MNQGLTMLVFGVLTFALTMLTPALAESAQQTEKKKVGTGTIQAPKGTKSEPPDTRHHRIRHIIKGKRGFLGVSLVRLTPELRKHYTDNEKAGVLIGKVENKSPAEKAGLKVGDILLAVDGQEVKSSWQVGKKIGTKKEGEKAQLHILRNGVKKQVTVAICERPRYIHDAIKVMHIGENDFDIDVEGLDQHLEQLEHLELHEHVRKTLKDPKIKKMLKSLKDNVELERKLEKKLEKVEEKLKKLEEKMQSKILHHKSKTST